MFQAVSEGAPAVSGSFAVFVIVCVIWAAHRHDKRKRELAQRAKRKAEIEAIVKSRPQDAPLFREALDELETDGPKGAA